MSFREYEIKREYRNQEKDIVREFYLPLMSESVLYKRAVGFFSSSALAAYSLGIGQLIKNDGHIQLIATPELSDEDIQAIKYGYELRDELLEKRIIDSLTTPINKFEEERLNLLATYIAENRLEIKIALVDNNNEIAIYHEKLGILHDGEGNIVCFTGSMNETLNGFKGNYETVDVFCDWNDPERVQDKLDAFQKIWNNEEKGVITKRFPNVEKEIFERYKKKTVNYKVDEDEFGIDFDNEKLKKSNLTGITFSEDTLYDYQKQAIQNWENNNFCGIYNMCTGAGKTFTAIGSIKRLYERKEGNLAVIIVAPYQHLVEQWVEDLERFNIHPVIGYSGSIHKDYRKILKNQIFDYNIGARKFICFICTNASFKIDEVQNLIKSIRKSTLLVVDEAHNFGTKELMKTLTPQFEYRLALSATLDRHGDPEGTEYLHSYFGYECIDYGLEQAIKEKRLTPYYYHPIVVYLSSDELERYENITREMRNYIYPDKSGRLVMTEKAKKLAIKRSRIVSGAISKVDALKECIEPYKKDKNLLIYCGATTLFSEDLDDLDVTEDIRQIDYITKVIGNDLDMNVSQFTSKEDIPTRKNLIQHFKEGKELQGLVAIKCLDEGVNIPSIKTAFILASTTNPKEYIQRRGRVLRKSFGKDYAEIFDFITLPRPLDVVKNLTEEETTFDESLVKNELNRIIEFKSLSLNPYDSNPLIDEIRETYNLYDEEFEDLDEYHFTLEED